MSLLLKNELSNLIEVLLLDGENRSTLAACRSLGRRGLKVAVIGPSGCITHDSRFCTKIIVQSDEPKTYVEELRGILRELSPRLFLPMSDRTIDLVTKDSRLINRAQLPSLESIETVQNKEQLLELCNELSVATPKSQFVSSVSDTATWSTFPAVLKTARASDTERRAKPAVKYFLNKSELNEYILENQAEFPWILQEQIVGPGVGVFVLAQDGEILTTFCHQRILEKPPAGGVSVLSKSISTEEAPIAESVKLIKALNWTGVAMLEFKYCSSRSSPFLIEINPRFWGSLQLSISCGVDFPWLLFLMSKMELGSKEGIKALENSRKYKVGRRLRWDLGTLDHLLIRLKQEKMVAVKDIILNNKLHFSLSADTVHETMAGDDLDPFWTELKNYCGSLFT